MHKGMCPVTWAAYVLMVIGGLNWGLVGIGGFMEKPLNVVNMLFGQWPTVENVVYIVVGLAAVWGVVKMFSCGCCSKDK